MSVPTDKLTASLADFAKVKTSDKVSNAALAAGKQLVRDARAELEALASLPAPSPPAVDLRPWVTPIGTDMVVGAPGVLTTLAAGSVIEHASLAGPIAVEGDLTLRFCRGLGPVNEGPTGTLIYLKNGHLITDHCELALSDGHSGIYQHGGIWTPIETWVHDNGANKGAEFQQVYCGAGRIEGGKGGRIDNGSDWGAQFYNSPDGTDKFEGGDWDGLEVVNCKHGLVVLSHRVNNMHLTNLIGNGAGEGAAKVQAEYGVRAYNLEGTGNLVTGHVWGAKQNIVGGPGLDTSGLIEAAP